MKFLKNINVRIKLLIISVPLAISLLVSLSCILFTLRFYIHISGRRFCGRHLLLSVFGLWLVRRLFFYDLNFQIIKRNGLHKAVLMESRLRKALELEKLRSHAYSTMIDLAEQTFNIPVRKKSGTKQ